MMPIRSEIKTKRLHWDGRPSIETQAYLKCLREDDDTKRIYEVDPYVEVYQFRENLYGFYADNLDGKGDVWMYLLIGPEKAMLIDTAYGLGNLKSLVDQITGGMEVIVVNTHDHYDHAYGNCYFEKVYCHEHLVPYLENQHPHMWDYVFDAEGQPIWVDFDRKALPEFKKYEIIGVPDGYVWDLGDGYEVELIHTGGHCAGHASYLDKKSRILFPGDILCSDLCGFGDIPSTRKGPYAEEADMRFFYGKLKKLTDRMGEYDTVFPMHFINDLDKCVVKNTCDTVKEILENPERYDFAKTAYGKDRDFRDVTYYKYIPGFSMVRYRYRKEEEGRI